MIVSHITKRAGLLLPAMGLFVAASMAQQSSGSEGQKEHTIRIELRTKRDGESEVFREDYESREDMLADETLKGFLDEHNMEVVLEDGKQEDRSHTNFGKQYAQTKQGIHIFSDTDSLLSFSFGGTGIFQFNGEDCEDSFSVKTHSGSEQEAWVFRSADSVVLQKLKRENLDSLGKYFEEVFDGNGNSAYVFNWKEDGDEAKFSRVVLQKKVTISKIEENETSLVRSGSRSQDNLEPLEISYFPNPNHGSFTLRAKLNSIEPLNVSITDLSGRKIYEEEVRTFDGNYSKTFDLSGQGAGIYLLQLVQGKSGLARKIIIN